MLCRRLRASLRQGWGEGGCSVSGLKRPLSDDVGGGEHVLCVFRVINSCQRASEPASQRASEVQVLVDG